MFQLLKDPDFDFMGKRRVFLGLSALVVLAAIVVLETRGIKLGIEFTGGTELQLKYAEKPDVGSIRSALARMASTSPVVTTIGDPARHEIYIKLGLAAEGEGRLRPLTRGLGTAWDSLRGRLAGAREEVAEGPEAVGPGGMTQRVVNALREESGQQRSADKVVDLNTADATVLGRLLEKSPGISRDGAQAIAEAIVARRKEVAIFGSLHDLSDIEGMTPEALRTLEQGAIFGPFAIRSQSYIGPVIGRGLIRNSLLAILGSLLGVLGYIWFRFQRQWGYAAVAALTHDTLITLGLFSLLDKEMSLPVVAAFLTLVGYSVNDTVVVFDRIRENIRVRGMRDLERLVNRSLNQTLSRTIITTGSTWIVVVGLFLYGGAALSAFSFVLTIGILVGTYSSIYVASPIVVMWRGLVARKQASSGARQPSSRRARLRGQT